MEKITKIITFSILGVIALVGILILLQNLKVDSVSNLKLEGQTSVNAGEGEICSTPTFAINCKEGLICANNNISDFNPNLETAKCTKIEYITDLNKTDFEWRKPII